MILTIASNGEFEKNSCACGSMSDLHLEFGPLELPPVRADVVILAGDVHLGVRGWPGTGPVAQPAGGVCARQS